MKNVTIQELEILFEIEVMEDEYLQDLSKEELKGEAASFLYRNNQLFRDITDEIVDVEEELEQVENDLIEIDENEDLYGDEKERNKKRLHKRVRIKILQRRDKELLNKLNKMINYMI